MGAWGHRSFENDSALDWLSQLAESDATLLGETLDAVGAADEEAEIELDEASAALAAAELVAAALDRGDERLPEDALTWLDGCREAVRGVGAARAHRAAQRAYEQSELRELWDENGTETEWHADVRELLSRLAS